MGKKSNGGIVVLMGIIIVILVVLCVLFATNTISLNYNSTKETTSQKNDSKDDEKKNSYVITYEDEEYTTKNKDDVENTKSKRNIVRVKNENHSDAANLIENKLNEISDKNWVEIKKTADDSDENPNTGLGVNYLIETGVITDNRLTFITNTDGTFGGVQWKDNAGYNFDATTGKILSLEDIGTGVFDYLYSKSISEIEKNSDGSCLEGDWKDRAKEELNKEGNWYFTTAGMKVIFPKYSIACGANGITAIDINKNDINSYLYDKYKIN